SHNPTLPPPPHPPLCGGFCLSDFTLEQRFPDEDENKEVQKVLPKIIPFPLLPFRHPPHQPPTRLPSPHLTPPPPPLCGGFCLYDFTLEQRFHDENKEVQKVLPKQINFFFRFHF